MYIDGAYCDWIPQTRVERGGQRQRGALEQELAGEQRAVELTACQRAHRAQSPSTRDDSVTSRGGDIRAHGGRHHAPWPASRIAPYILLGIRTGRAIRQPQTAALLPRGAAVVVPPVQPLLAPGPFRRGPARARLPGPDERSRPE